MDTKKLFNLTGKTAIVTGAGRNLGQYIAKGLSDYGANVIVVDIFDKFAKTLSMLNKNSIALKVDITNNKEVKKLVKIVESKFGSVDILVNNAAICPFQNTFTVKPEEFMKVIEVNLLGMFLCCRAVFQSMKKRGSGKIINIASILGIVGQDKQIYTDDIDNNLDVYAFTSSKGAVINLTRDLAAHWGSFNINVNSISPGMMMTGNIKKNINKGNYDENIISRLESRIPLKRLGEPSELIGGVIFLASDASNYVNGHNLVIDGGWVCL